MDSVLRRHVSLRPETVRFLEEYQQQQNLASFSAALEAAVKSLELQQLEAAYREYAQLYEDDPEERVFAESWLGSPMDEQ